MQATRVCLIRFTQDANRQAKAECNFPGDSVGKHSLPSYKHLKLYFTQVIPFPFHFLTEQVPAHKKP